MLAVGITIMVLEIHVPDSAELSALYEVAPTFIAYVISFAFVGIYWNNHHHMLQVAHKVNGRVLWMNLHLLFWLSLIPALTKWVGKFPYEPVPMALYGADMLMSGVASLLLQRSLLAIEGADSKLARAIGSDTKGKISAVAYAIAIGLSFVSIWIAVAIYAAVAILWFIPDRRMERLYDETDG